MEHDLGCWLHARRIGRIGSAKNPGANSQCSSGGEPAHAGKVVVFAAVRPDNVAFWPRQYINLAPGALVQADTIRFIDWRNGERFYIYTLVDLYSRWAYAEYKPKLRQNVSVQFVLRAQKAAPFAFRMVQTDNGPEFGKDFGDRLAWKGIQLRHSRVRQSNDNAHIERFNRTLQDECLTKFPLPETAKERLVSFLSYYNNA